MGQMCSWIRSLIVLQYASPALLLDMPPYLQPSIRCFPSGELSS